MEERNWNQEEQVDGIAAARSRVVRLNRQPGHRVVTPPSLVAADPRHAGQVHQAKTDGRAEQYRDQDGQDAAVALRGVVLTAHLTCATKMPASNTTPIADTIAP